MIRLADNISEADRKEVERRLKALERPERKKTRNIGFNWPDTYGLTFSGRDEEGKYWSVNVFGKTYAERQEAIYKYVMEEQNAGA